MADCIVQKQGTFLAIRSYPPLSQREGVRVRGFRGCARPPSPWRDCVGAGRSPSPPALSRGERELWAPPCQTLRYGLAEPYQTGWVAPCYHHH
jgi:hypothetical protein